MVTGFSPGLHSRDVYERRRDSCTREELNKLFATPEFQAWCQGKARAGAIRWEVVGGASLVALYTLCTFFVLLLGTRVDTAAGMGSVAALANTAQPISSPAQPAQFRNSTLFQSNIWHAPLEIPASLRREEELLLQRLDLVTGELGRVRMELEEALDLSSELSFQLLATAHEPAVVAAEAAPAGEAAPAEPPPQLPVQQQAPAQATCHTPAHALPLAAVNAAPAVAAQYANSTIQLGLESLFSTWADKPAASQLVAAEEGAVAEEAASFLAAYAPLLGVMAGAVLVAAYLSTRATLRHLRSKEQELQRRLQDTAFAKETAEQSLQLLEQALRRKVEQVESMQQKASAAASPLSVTSDPCSPYTPASLYTPGRGELPPPPAQLVEKFLKDRHAVAVEEAQVEEWLLMEGEFARVRAELAALAEQRANMEAYHQVMTDKPRQKSREEHAAHLKEWLDVAQEELLNTQSQLQESEAECRKLSTQLAAARQGAGSTQDGEVVLHEKERDLLEQNLALVAELQKVTAAFETLQAQFSSAQVALAGKDAESRRAAAELSSALQEAAAQERPASLAGSSPPAELSGEVDSMIELMRTTRLSLASRLSRSQQVCAQTINGLTKLARQEELGVGTGTGPLLGRSAKILQSPPAARGPSCQGSPAGAVAEKSPLGSSTRQNTSVANNFSFSALPAKRFTPRKPLGGGGGGGNENTSPTAGAGKNEGSLRRTREAAKKQVHSIRAQYSSFELGAFLHRMGCLAVAPASAASTCAEWEAVKEHGLAALSQKASQGKTVHERALAGEALQVLRDWQWPVQPIKAPPQSPAWYRRVANV